MRNVSILGRWETSRLSSEFGSDAYDSPGSWETWVSTTLNLFGIDLLKSYWPSFKTGLAGELLILNLYLLTSLDITDCNRFSSTCSVLIAFARCKLSVLDTSFKNKAKSFVTTAKRASWNALTNPILLSVIPQAHLWRQSQPISKQAVALVAPKRGLLLYYWSTVYCAHTECTSSAGQALCATRSCYVTNQLQ